MCFEELLKMVLTLLPTKLFSPIITFKGRAPPLIILMIKASLRLKIILGPSFQNFIILVPLTFFMGDSIQLAFIFSNPQVLKQFH